MTLTDILIIIFASLIGVGYLLKIRSYDIYDKEPFFKLLIVSIIGGGLSVIISLLLYEFVEVERNFGDAIIKIGLIEESSKLFALIIIYMFIKKDFNEIVDGIIYISAISLGFSIIENIFYCFKSNEPFLLLFQRSIFSVVGHISFSGYLGIAFYIHKRIRRNYIGILFSIFLASIAHGFYDGVIFHQELNFLFRFVFIGLIVLQFWLLRIALGFSEFREKLTEKTFVHGDKTTFLNCSRCDLSIKSNELSFWRIKAGICNKCGNYVFNPENIYNLFRYFRPIKNYQKYIKDLPSYERITSLDDNKKIQFNTKRKFLSANVNDLGVWLDENNDYDREEIFEIPIIGFIFKYLGLRYMSTTKITVPNTQYSKWRRK